METENQALSLQTSYKLSNKAGTRDRIFNIFQKEYSRVETIPTLPSIPPTSHPCSEGSRGLHRSTAKDLAQPNSYHLPFPAASKGCTDKHRLPGACCQQSPSWEREKIPGEHPVRINTATKTKAADREAHVLENNPRDHLSQKLKCLENMRPRCKERANQEALGTC